MIDFLKEYFHISEKDKISEKAILMRLAVTVAVILFCLVSMGTTAFAYFSHNSISQKFIIKSANFQISVSARDNAGNPVAVNADNRTKPCFQITANVTYSISITHSNQSSAKTGFIVLTAERCTQKYITQQLGKDGAGNTETLSFTLKSNNDTTVYLLSHWGTSSFYGYQNKNNAQINSIYIAQGDHVEISATAPVIVPPETTVPETTVKVPEQTSPPKPMTTAPSATEPQKPVEITVPVTTGNPTPETQPPAPQTEVQHTTAIEPIVTVTTSVQTTTQETEAPPQTPPPETEVSQVPIEVQPEPEATNTPEAALVDIQE